MKRNASGFTLAELAIVTVIVGLLLGGMLSVLSTQIEQRQSTETQKTLELARDALIGYFIANGRLPCPAVSASAADTGVEAPLGGSTGVTPCTATYSGFYPAVTVGLTPTDANGYLLDSYGSRIRYAVTIAPTGVPNTFTTPNQVKNTGIANITPPSSGSPYLSVCSTGTTTTGVVNAGAANATCATAAKLTDGAVAVLFSLGRNWATGGGGTDEARNLDNDRVFISHTVEPAGAANGEFDDLVTWLSPNVLYNRLIAAGAM
jgi:type II secretory pathway pseudopilin PulG